jgi:hypothetical protein
MSSPSPGTATSDDATATSGDGLKGLVKMCLLFGRNNSRSRTILVSSRALMVAAAAMSLSQILVYDWQPSYTCATVDVTHVFIRYRQVLVEALQGDIMMFAVAAHAPHAMHHCLNSYRYSMGVFTTGAIIYWRVSSATLAFVAHCPSRNPLLNVYSFII